MKDVKKLSQEQIIEEMKKIPLPLSSEKDSKRLNWLMDHLDDWSKVSKEYKEEMNMRPGWGFPPDDLGMGQILEEDRLAAEAMKAKASK